MVLEQLGFDRIEQYSVWRIVLPPEIETMKRDWNQGNTGRTRNPNTMKKPIS